MKTEPWTEERIKTLGPTTKARIAFQLLGVSEMTGYAALRAGTFPVRALRIGKKWVIPTAGLIEVLGLAASPETAA
ncbi:hypothetical protein [Segniliparus rugosus]|uniref:Helix-turn-helix domain-containing protein n=1 Tax=Segniliparus rugosus (strain ATCC BAA-974 / DSM 45345 / CCUG 50838 / CIP 108380 / JCM 13579 / CDC 945) TaxID=679197 RepID=E5XLR3_SEGRC|nr:hypothetical protein [Segniliparus rugosus]EFV14741.1 hypothetical protein HMPREF9336_00432 [Segniliparus rugosus ATCC BAA-974]